MKKLFLLLTLAILSLCAACSNGTGSTPTPPSSTGQTPSPSPTAQAQSNITSSMEQDAETALRFYLDHINEVRNNNDWSDENGSMALVYINDDEIPELVIDWPDAASGGQILTVSNGELVSVQLSRGEGISYIERQNLFLHNNGHMDYYYDSVYAIQDGEFVRLHFGEEIGTITDNEESPYEVSYTWDGEDVSSTEYQERLNAAFDHAKAVNTWGENSFNAEEIIQIINGLLEYSSTTAANGQSSSTNVTQGSSLDERLLGTWIEQLVPDYLTLERVFSPDGTGTWWGDGPGQTFTWSVNDDVLTMDIHDEAGNEWTQVCRYEFDGDTLTITDDGGWQNIYLRESAASANQSSGDAAANEVLYNGVPVINLIGSRLADLRDLLGNPDVEGVVWEGGTYGYRYDIYGDFDGIVFNKSQHGEDIEAIWGNPAALTFNRSSLDKNRDELVELFGAPGYEDWNYDYGIESYFIQFDYKENYSISFELNSPNDRAHEFWIHYSE